MFAPPEEYFVEQKDIELSTFREYPDMFILRPPYQRHSGVWPNKMKEQFLDSLFRKYYIPKIVLREVRIDGKTTQWEVIDGQQRITTLLEFFDKNSGLKLPESLKDLSPELHGKKYSQLPADKRIWIDKQLFIKADVIKNISEKDNATHLKIASDLFYRLQQGEPLTMIESLHSKLGSNVRNFVSTYADDFSFDYENYKQIEKNDKKHPFFSKIINMNNDRMQQLLLLTRFLMIGLADGATDVGNVALEDFFLNKYPVKSKKDMIDKEFLNLAQVKIILTDLDLLYKIYKNNPLIDPKRGLRYLRKDYFLISLYMLFRHLKRYYVFEEKEYKIFDEFSKKFYLRLVKKDPDDKLIMQFRDNRQQSKENLESRERIIRMIFFSDYSLKPKDPKRLFNEAEKIEIYIRDKGICKKCYEEFLSQGMHQEEAEKNAVVPWSNYDADHIKAWTRGGETKLEQGQVLCRPHNRSKGGGS